jgi:hypothetical protein
MKLFAESRRLLPGEQWRRRQRRPSIREASGGRLARSERADTLRAAFDVHRLA